MATSVQNSCDVILNSVRASFLNYSCSETPYSLYLTIRKSWVKTSSVSDNHQFGTRLEELDSLKLKLKSLEDSNESLKIKYDESVNDCEEANIKVNQLETKLSKFENIANSRVESKGLIIEQMKKERAELQTRGCWKELQNSEKKHKRKG